MMFSLFECKKCGHFKRNCPKNSQHKRGNKRKERDGAHIVEDSKEPKKKTKEEDPRDLFD